MNNWLIEKFVVNRAKGNKALERSLSGSLSGIVGIVINLLLGAAKLALGLLTGSMALLTDSVNNLSDSAASAVTLVGFKLASRRSTSEYPFGYARFEYMTGVVTSALIIIVGGKVIYESYRRIISHGELELSTTALIIAAALILVKIWLYILNLKLAKHIDSASLKATAIDSRNDAIQSAAVIVALFFQLVTRLYADGYIGLAVGVFILYSGLKLVRETAGPLLGQAPDPELVSDIVALAKRPPEVIGIHDLIVHNYGPGNIFASVHIEVDAHADVFKSHEMIEQIELDANSELDIQLVCHMDPLDTADPRIGVLMKKLSEALSQMDAFIGLHDLRIVQGLGGSEKVFFDIVITHSAGEEEKTHLTKSVTDTLKNESSSYIPVITFDIDYT